MLLNCRTESVYVRLWQFVRHDLPQNLFDWVYVIVITDFEMALRNAVKRVTPECKLLGGWFYFNQVVK